MLIKCHTSVMHEHLTYILCKHGLYHILLSLCTLPVQLVHRCEKCRELKCKARKNVEHLGECSLLPLMTFTTFQQGFSTASWADSCLNIACHFGFEQSSQTIQKEWERRWRDGETNKGVEQLRRGVIADQMWEAHPFLARKHTLLSR